MRKHTIMLAATCLLTTGSVQAVDTTDYSQPGMKQMALAMNKMQDCIGQVDELEQNRYEVAINRMQNELLDLCRSGKTEAAQSKALVFSREAQTSHSFQQMMACSKTMRDQGFMPQLPVLSLDQDGNSSEAVCDRYNY
ncbi:MULTISPECIES: hypothetical protein [Thiomicrorhabdus]|uniref:Uncharacterized protein n=1 Tax=Thiomicrorhabdus xiamenensis TaxID=2739063 RepID=A0A7D4SZM6_9GAMM|nr:MULTISPECIES: hypothetical protein [Thiomicrorhabdus]MBO1923752.1 hypothetical protein [Thiomicrorhabdus sp. 6S3-12]QKI88622.1 hypothetical protein HQN79_03060 [Thiomicrorhabdus xiamenensis]